VTGERIVEITTGTLVALMIIVGLNTLFVAGLTIALFMIWRQLDQAVKKSEPLLQKAAQTLGKVEETTVQLQARVDKVLEKTTELVEHVTERVDTTTAIAEEAVTEPLIGAASLMAGIHRGLKAYSERASVKGDGADG